RKSAYAFRNRYMVDLSQLVIGFCQVREVEPFQYSNTLGGSEERYTPFPCQSPTIWSNEITLAIREERSISRVSFQVWEESRASLATPLRKRDPVLCESSRVPDFPSQYFVSIVF